MANSELLIKINANAKQVTKALNSVKDQTKDLEQRLASTAKISGAAFAGFAGTIGLAAREASKLEDLTVQFEVLTGSAEQGRKTMEELTDFAATTPFQLQQLGQAGKQLIGFGFQAEELTDRLQEIGDVAAVTGKPVGELATIFGQVTAEGKLTGERLRQLQESAVPIAPALAKVMGVAETEIKGLVTAGEIGAAEFREAFASISAEGGIAFQGMVKQSKTLSGVISTLKDNFSLFAADIGKEFLPMFKTVATTMIEFLRFLRENKAIAKTAALFLGLGAAITGVITAVSVAALGFLKLRAAVIAARVAVQGMTISVRTLMGATGIGLILVGISALVANWSKVWPFMQGVFAGFVKSITSLAQGLGNVLTGVFTFDLDQVKRGLSQTKEAMTEGLNEFNATYKEKKNEQLETDRDIASKQLETQKQKHQKEMEQETLHAELMKEMRMEREELRREEELTKNQLRQQIQREHETNMAKIRQKFRKENLKAEQNVREQRFKERQQEHQRFLEEEVRFGTALAKTRQLFRSQEFKGTQQALSNLSTLQRTKNKELFAIGKAAAFANATVNIAQGITKALSFGPIIGPILAATVAAAGAVQLGTIASSTPGFQEGGVVTGGTPGRDSVPAVLAPGEIVAPERNFDEVVNAVADQRNAQRRAEGGDEDEPSALVDIRLSGELAEIVEAQIVERQKLGVSLLPDLGV